jgi:hypothetical protein
MLLLGLFDRHLLEFVGHQFCSLTLSGGFPDRVSPYQVNSSSIMYRTILSLTLGENEKLGNL